MSRYRKPKGAIRPSLMWTIVSPEGWMYTYIVTRTRAEAIQRWDANDLDGPSWPKYRAKGWRTLAVVVTPFVDPAQLRDVEVQP